MPTCGMQMRRLGSFRGACSALVLMAPLIGCQATTSDSCVGWRPIRPTQKDVQIISDKLAADILSHNEHGKDICGWKAK